MKTITVTFKARHTGVTLYSVAVTAVNTSSALNTAYAVAIEQGFRVYGADVAHSFN